MREAVVHLVDTLVVDRREVALPLRQQVERDGVVIAGGGKDPGQVVDRVLIGGAGLAFHPGT